MRASKTIIGFLLALGVACSRDMTAPAPVDHDAEGFWTQDNHGAVLPGSSFSIVMTETSGSITGSGSYSGEAGPSGSLQVSGAVHDDSLHLQIVFVADPATFPALKPDTTQFAGVLVSRAQIHGQLTRGGQTSEFDMVRIELLSDPH